MQTLGIGIPLLIALLPLAGMAVLQFVLPVLAPLMTASAKQAPEAYGWLAGALGLGSICFLLSNHAILPVFGPVRTLRLGLAVAIAGVVLILTGVWSLMIVGTFFVGYGYATTTPAGSQILADFTPRALWGTLFSVRMAAVPVGGIVAGALGSWVAAAYGWRAALVPVIGICAGTALVLLFVPRRYNESRPLKRFVAVALFDVSNLRRPWQTLRRTPGLGSLVFGSWCMSWVHAVVTSFFVIYLTGNLEVSLARAAGLFAFLQGVAIIGRIIFGAIGDRIGSPVPVLKLLAPLSAASALVLSAMSADWSLPSMAIASAVIGLTVGTWNGLYLAEIARLSPPGEVGEATASAAVFGFSAYLIAPPVAGALFAVVGFRTTFQLVALFALLGWLVFVLRGQTATTPKRRSIGLSMRSAFTAGFALTLVVSALALRGAAPDRAKAALGPQSLLVALTDLPASAAFPDVTGSAGLSQLSPRGQSSAGVSAIAALELADTLLDLREMAAADRDEAAYWLSYAVRNPLPALAPPRLGWAWTQLGSLLAQPGDGRTADYVAARKAWEIAGLVGDPVALCFDAQLYAFGLGGAVDHDQARRLYAQARARGGCAGMAKALTPLR
jgi:MFS family permease